MKLFIYDLCLMLLPYWVQFYLAFTVIGKKDKRKHITDPAILAFIQEKTGVMLKYIRLIPSHLPFGGMRSSWFFWPSMLLSTTLYDSFTKLELEYVLLHEAGHYQLRHNNKLTLWLIFYIIVGNIFLFFITTPQKLVYLLPLLILTVVLLLIRKARKYEFEADRYAVRKLNNPVTMISATEKFKDAYTFMPRNFLVNQFYSRTPYRDRLKIAEEEIIFREKQAISL